MRAAGVLVTIAAALALQTTFTRFLVRGTVAVDLVLVAVVYLALIGGPTVGVVAGTIGGLAQDALSSGILGMGGLAKTVIGFLTGVAGTHFIVGQAAARGIVFFAAGLAHSLVLAGMYALLGLRQIDLVFSRMAAQAGMSAVLGVVLFEIVEFLPGAMERRRAAGRGKLRVRPRI
ncbi:MAG: rod shape-determining protein MreD [Acidobacteria bacterium]|nr:rod shape-determining protein MreD [Acidobacteriota bacterium]MBI3262994.1 rod shape-determining protein MreD [Acidobacteriota bacterium]